MKSYTSRHNTFCKVRPISKIYLDSSSTSRKDFKPTLMTQVNSNNLTS